MSPLARNHWQFSLATLFLGVTGAAIVCCVVPYPYVAFYSLLVVFFLAAILARIGPHNGKQFWFWFSLFGWAYILLGSITGDAVEASMQWNIRAWLHQNNPGPGHWTPEHYLLFGHFILAICIASLGATLTSAIAAHHDKEKGKEPISIQGPK